MAPWPEVEKPETNNYIGDSSKQNQNMAGKEGENHKGNVLTLSYKKYIGLGDPWRRWKVMKQTFKCSISSGNVASLGNKGEIQPAFSTVALIDETRPEEEDPWALPELQDTGVKWSGSHFSVNKLPTLFPYHLSHILQELMGV